MIDVPYVKYSVKLTIRDRVLANVPTDFGAFRYIAKAQLEREGKTATPEEIEERVKEISKDMDVDEETLVEKVVQSFFDDEGLYIRERNIKGLLKECGRMLNIRGYREAINHGVFVKPEKIYYTADGDKIKQADTVVESGIRVTGPRVSVSGARRYAKLLYIPRGPRSALKIAEGISNPELRFQVWIIPSVARRRFPEKKFKEMLGYGQEIGLQGDRSMGEGKFDVEVEKISKEEEEKAE